MEQCTTDNSKHARRGTEEFGICCSHSIVLPLVHARIPNLILASNRLERLERKKERDTPPPPAGGRGGGMRCRTLTPLSLSISYTISLFSPDFGVQKIFVLVVF